MVARCGYLVKDHPCSEEETEKKTSLRMKVGHKQTKCFAWGYTAGHLWRGKWSPGLSDGGVTTFFAENLVAWLTCRRGQEESVRWLGYSSEEDLGCLLDLMSRLGCSLLRLCALISIILPCLKAVSTPVWVGRAAVCSALPHMALLTLFNGHDGDRVVWAAHK